MIDVIKLNVWYLSPQILACRRQRHVANVASLSEFSNSSHNQCVWLRDTQRARMTHISSPKRAYAPARMFTYPRKHLAYPCTPLFSTSGRRSAERRATDGTAACTVESVCAQLSHLLPFLYAAESSGSAWQGLDVKWRLTLAVEERSLRGPHSLEEEKGLPIFHHHIMLLYIPVSCWLTGWFVVVVAALL